MVEIWKNIEEKGIGDNEMKSIIQNRKECYNCFSMNNLEMHHCLFGSANRKLSEKDGLKVWLCAECHRGTFGVHRQKSDIH